MIVSLYFNTYREMINSVIGVGPTAVGKKASYVLNWAKIVYSAQNVFFRIWKVLWIITTCSRWDRDFYRVFILRCGWNYYVQVLKGKS